MNAPMLSKSQFNFFVWGSHAQKSKIKPLVPSQGSATPTRPRCKGIFARLAVNHTDVPKVRQVSAPSRRHPRAATTYHTPRSGPLIAEHPIPSIPLSERRIRVLRSPTCRLPSTKKG